ncbi:MAG: hypothetical protein HC919_07830 [Oscillatoriales cyanobacterium SM2_2_1]|nr:hypothetical protein [Oscillatoriales cyanobacterium SM2_2_1]
MVEHRIGVGDILREFVLGFLGVLGCLLLLVLKIIDLLFDVSFGDYFFHGVALRLNLLAFSVSLAGV